mmetsp:Transcript_9895/g.22732  ORF Transcript_9895/g.22732 Transcript_9895/m.22732 type:complete len:258 (-) Transcript_9895:104-877(-)
MPQRQASLRHQVSPSRTRSWKIAAVWLGALGVGAQQVRECPLISLVAESSLRSFPCLHLKQARKHSLKIACSLPGALAEVVRLGPEFWSRQLRPSAPPATDLPQPTQQACQHPWERQFQRHSWTIVAGAQKALVEEGVVSSSTALLATAHHLQPGQGQLDPCHSPFQTHFSTIAYPSPGALGGVVPAPKSQPCLAGLLGLRYGFLSASLRSALPPLCTSTEKIPYQDCPRCPSVRAWQNSGLHRPPSRSRAACGRHP